MFAFHDVSWRRELQIMTPTTRTADLWCFGASYVIVVMSLADQGIGDLYGVAYCGCLRPVVLGKLVRQGNDLLP